VKLLREVKKNNMVESVTIDTSSETEGPTLEEQAEAMDSQVEEQQVEEEATGDRPEWLPEKFNSPEDMAKAYSELETKLGSGESQDTDEFNENETRETLDDAGVDYDALSAEFWETGNLSDESYQQLREAGVPKEIVDSYIDSQLNMVETKRSSIMNEVGGPDGYQALTAWAADNLDDGEIDYFNSVMDGNDFNAVSMTVKSLAARRDASEGMEPRRNLSGSMSGGGASAYDSVAQLMADMQSPKYDTDAAFRASVEAKLGRSNIM